MSLTAQYDDLCRYSSVLTTGCEKEFIDFVKNQVNLIHKIKKMEQEIQILKKQNSILETEKRKHDCQMRHTKILLELEIQKRRQIELEKTQLEKKIVLIQKILPNTAFDNETKDTIYLLSNPNCKEKKELQTNLITIHDAIGSLLSLSDADETFADEKYLDFDAFQEQIQVYEESSDESNNPIQEKKNEENLASGFNEIESIYQIKTDEISEIKCSKSTVPKEINCSNSPKNNESTIANEIPEIKSSTAQINSESTSSSLAQLPDLIVESDSGFFRNCWHSFRLRRTNSNLSSTPKNRCNSLGRIQRIHSFVSKPVIRADKCYLCCKTIAFCKQASKCSKCKITCHPECKEQCPLPCLPITLSLQNSIVSFNDSTSTKIPSIIFRCINEIESRGLGDVGLYRMSGSDREVKDFKEKLLKGKNLNMSKVDIHVICGVMKEFLRSLKEPLISKSIWKMCVEAANQDNENIGLKLLYDAICDLPNSNRKILAFLLLHLQKVADSTECKMPHENLAKIFGPTVVGYSTDDPSNSNILLETGQQCSIEKQLELAKVRKESEKNPQTLESGEPSSITDKLESLVKSIKTLTIQVPVRSESFNLFFHSLEKAFQIKSVPDELKAEILLNILGERVNNLLTYVSQEDLSNYVKIKELILREFEPTPQECLSNFKKARKLPSENYVQFASRLSATFDYYCQLRKVNEFRSLCDLIISDKIFETLDRDTMNHIATKQGETYFKPQQLGRECDAYLSARGKVSNDLMSRYPGSGVKTDGQIDCRRLKECRSEKNCFCLRPHNSLIHFSRDKTRNPTPTSNLNLDAPTFVPGQIEGSVEANSQSQFVATGFEKGRLKNVFLSTVRALVKNKYSQWVEVRCLLDVGSQSCLCTRACAEKLQLKMEKINTVVSCVNDASMVVKNCVKTSVANKAKTFESELMLLVVNKITDLIPNKVIDVDVNVSEFVPLADDKFNIPDRIDMLLGAEIFYELLKPGKFYCDNSHLVLQNTVFGYVVSGSVDHTHTQVTENRVHCGLIVDDDLNKTLKNSGKLRVFT
ncbi:rac GTPase-activating protein 1 [Trichonephila clavipes]|nr:rac GTPase-activating protein 1 [Trichonephila clavipes]